MITLITGAPGAGKSAALVDLLGQEAQRRALFVDGIPELKLPHVPLDEPRKWPELVEDGAAVVIDEVQRVWRPRGAGSAVPADIAALETHRHRGLDFYLVTQHPNLLDANVRRLVGRHVHLRDNGMLGRWWYEWPEATNPETFRSAPIKKRYSLPKAAFGLYKSASMHVKPVRSMPMSLVVLALALLSLLGLTWKAYASISEKVIPKEATQTQEPKAEKEPAQQALTASPAATVATGEATPTRPAVVGCFASARTCRCFDKQGFPITVEWEMCKVSATSFAGLVPLDLTPSKPEASIVQQLAGAGVQPQERAEPGSQDPPSVAH